MVRKRSARSKPAAKPVRDPAPIAPAIAAAIPPAASAAAPLAKKAWTVLIYMCGDNSLEPDVGEDFEEIYRVGSSPHMHVVVQCDTPKGAQRYLLPEGGTRDAPPCDKAFQVTAASGERQPRPLNTGDPEELKRFMLWGIEQVPSEHVALVLSGLGINPKYVRDHLPVELGSLAVPELRAEVHQRLFSICHDATSRATLDISQLRQVLRDVTERLAAADREPKIDLVGTDLGASSFIEIVYELEDLAEVFVGSQTSLPDDGWPYDQILKRWQELAQREDSSPATARGHDELVREMGANVVDALVSVYAGRNCTSLVALDLRCLESVALALDSLALALLQSLGDWHVLDAIGRAGEKTNWIELEGLERNRLRDAQSTIIPAIDFLPAVDLIELLENLSQVFKEKLDRAGEVPADFGQRRRLEALLDLTLRTLAVIDDTDAGQNPLIYHKYVKRHRGISILAPPRRTGAEIRAESGQLFSLSHTNYLRLNFSQRVHWAALVGTVQLIQEKPHALWRVISSMLADASGPARDAAMRRLMSSDSVIVDLREQYQSLGENEAHTLSLEPLEPLKQDRDLRPYRLRLETSLAGGIVAQDENLLSQSKLADKLQKLQELLSSTDTTLPVQQRLRSLGQRLGEDLLQDVAIRLTKLHDRVDPSGECAAPHLTLQIPPELMKYPWELMHDQLGMLGERFAFGRQVFMESSATRAVPRHHADTIRVLVIGDPQFSPDFVARCARERRWRLCQLPSARNEAEVVCDEFERMRAQMAGVLRFRVTPLIGKTVSVDDVRDLLRNGDDNGCFDIVHYAGHAYYDAQNSANSGWLLSDGILTAGEIRNTLAWTTSPPWLVFANACEAGMDAGQPANKYQRDVFGLVTAFINRGVAAYIAPLWPVDDRVAHRLAAGFYRELLLSRYSLGESLRRAKSAVWTEIQDLADDEGPLSPRLALSWASLALYGDPTTRVLQSLWSPHSGESQPSEVAPGGASQPSAKTVTEVSRRSSPPPQRTKTRPVAGRRATSRRGFRRGAAEDLRRQILQPRGFLKRADETRGLTIQPGERSFEMIETGGLRYWRMVDATGQQKFLPGSPFAELVQNEKIRGVLGAERGLWDYARVVGRWMLDKVTGGDEVALLTGLVTQYDRDMVPKEQLLSINADGSLEPLVADRAAGWLDRPPRPGEPDRVLLFIHGTFSKTHVEELAVPPASGERRESFLQWTKSRYRAVLGFDHWTLSKSPEKNAELLWELLPKSLQHGHRLDVITHSRGGLVGRAFVELLEHRAAVRKLVFVGTPNSGTTLADPRNWGRMADLLLNLVHTDPTGFIGRLSGFLVHMLVAGAEQYVPGLLAQSPSAQGSKDFLGRLQGAGPPRDGVSYYAVAANYAPARDDFNLKALLAELGDQTMDKIFAGPNDLVVDTAHVWAVDAQPDFSKVGPAIPADNVLLFHSDRNLKPPAGIHLDPTAGVHHVNFFQFAAVQEFLRGLLAPEDGK